MWLSLSCPGDTNPMVQHGDCGTTNYECCVSLCVYRENTTIIFVAVWMASSRKRAWKRCLLERKGRNNYLTVITLHKFLPFDIVCVFENFVVPSLLSVAGVEAKPFINYMRNTYKGDFSKDVWRLCLTRFFLDIAQVTINTSERFNTIYNKEQGNYKYLNIYEYIFRIYI